MFGRKTRTFVPAMSYHTSDRLDEGELKMRRKKRQQQVKTSFDNRASKLKQNSLQVNQPVWFQHKGSGDAWSPAKVESASNSDRSYVIQTEDGTMLRRNRVHLRPRDATEKEVDAREPGTTAEEPRTTADEPRTTADEGPIAPATSEPRELRRSTRLRCAPSWMRDYTQ